MSAWAWRRWCWIVGKGNTSSPLDDPWWQIKPIWKRTSHWFCPAFLTPRIILFRIVDITSSMDKNKIISIPVRAVLVAKFTWLLTWDDWPRPGSRHLWILSFHNHVDGRRWRASLWNKKGWTSGIRGIHYSNPGKSWRITAREEGTGPERTCCIGARGWQITAAIF